MIKLNLQTIVNFLMKSIFWTTETLSVLYVCNVKTYFCITLVTNWQEGSTSTVIDGLNLTKTTQKLTSDFA